MEFKFSEDQLLLQQTVRDFLAAECTPEQIRGLWPTETGRSAKFWEELAQIGVQGLLVPEANGGLGMDEMDFVLVLEEAGRAALAEPIVGTAAVGVPILLDLERQNGSDLAQKWLGEISEGRAILAVGHTQSPFVSDAHVADLLLLPDGEDLHAVTPDRVQLEAQPSNDQSRRLFSVAWEPSDSTRVAAGEVGAEIQRAALDRGALACAAQQLGVGQQLIDMGAL